MNSIFKQHYYLKTIHLIRIHVFNLFRLQIIKLDGNSDSSLGIGHAALNKCKYLRFYDKEEENESKNGFAN